MKITPLDKLIYAGAFIIISLMIILTARPLLPAFLQQIALTPSPQLIYCTMAVAVLNFLWSPFLYFIGKKDKLNDKFISFKEELLTKKLIIPICIEPLTVFVEKEAQNITKLHSTKNIDQEKVKLYIAHFKSEKARIINKFMILGSIDSASYKYISDEIDRLEDSVVEYCGLNIISGFDLSAQKNRKYDEAYNTFYEVYRKVLTYFIIHYERIIIQKQKMEVPKVVAPAKG